MKKTLLIVMAMMVLIAAAGCRADDRKEDKPSTPPSAEVLPDNDVNGDNAGEIPENGVDSGKENNVQNDTVGDPDNTLPNDDALNGGADANATAAPELVPSAEATPPNTTDDVKK